MYDVQVDEDLNEEHPNLIVIPSLHQVECVKTDLLLFVVVNIGQEKVHLPWATHVSTLIPQEIDISEITTETAESSHDEGYMTNDEVIEQNTQSPFITSPADVEVHRKTNLIDADVEDK